MSTNRPRKPTNRTIPEDPVVAEVRRIRARMLKKAGGTLKGLQKYVDELSANRAEAARIAKAKPARSSRRRRAA